MNPDSSGRSAGGRPCQSMNISVPTSVRIWVRTSAVTLAFPASPRAMLCWAIALVTSTRNGRVVL